MEWDILFPHLIMTTVYCILLFNCLSEKANVNLPRMLTFPGGPVKIFITICGRFWNSKAWFYMAAYRFTTEIMVKRDGCYHLHILSRYD